jgi:hypothetical protein
LQWVTDFHAASTMGETKMIRKIAIAALLALATPCTAAPADGIDAVLSDPLLDHLTGHWQLAGTVQGKPAMHTVDAQWILGHQFLQIHELGALDPKTGKPTYEAFPTIGYDNTSDRYVAHWLDVFGGRFSETLGYGTHSGNAIDFVFEYPDGPFHTSFTFDPAHDQWRWHLTQKNAQGQWTDFADMTMSRRAE